MPSYKSSQFAASNDSGFSLVEIVVVLTLVGMVTAFAIPRFTRLGNQTRASEVVALSADLRDASQDAHAQFVASNSTLMTARLKGKSVMLKNGYPDTSINGIGNAIVDWGSFITKTTPTYVTFLKIGSPSNSQCSVTYRAALGPSVAAAVTDINISGC
jgi:MSHA pilin protein MshA